MDLLMNTHAMIQTKGKKSNPKDQPGQSKPRDTRGHEFGKKIFARGNAKRTTAKAAAQLIERANCLRISSFKKASL